MTKSKIVDESGKMLAEASFGEWGAGAGLLDDEPVGRVA
jgi:hypothetical protein